MDDKTPFSETIPQNIMDSIISEIQDDLFDNWMNSLSDEGNEWLDYNFFMFADDDVKKQYNEYYGYTQDDEYYLPIEGE